MRSTWYRTVVAVTVAVWGLMGCAGNPGVAGQGGVRQERSEQAQRAAGIRLQLAVGYYEQRQLSVALEEIRQALQSDPDFADAYSMRGLIYMDMGEARLAEESFQQALRLSPNNPDFNNNYGWFLCQNGRPAQSIAYFENALKVRSYQSPAKALNNAGACSLKLNDKASAEKYFTQAFQYDPGNVATNASLAKLFFDRRDYDRARFYVGRVVKADAADADLLWLGIKAEHKLGNQAAVQSLATQLRRRYPASAEYAAYQRGAFDE